MTFSHILGFPRIGKNREMKKTVEAYWAGKIDSQTLIAEGKKLRAQNWETQRQAGLDVVTVGDFTWYDHVLDLSVMLEVIPERLEHQVGTNVELDTLFRMARGRAPTGKDVVACEMTKWFDTNYHYIVPELNEKQTFRLAHFKLFEEVQEAQELGHQVKPVLLGPLSYLWLSKSKDNFNKLTLLDKLVAAYGQILAKLKELKIEWVQIDEPILSLDLPQVWKDSFESVYTRLKQDNLKILLTSYFGSLGDNASFVCALPVDGVHVDLTQDPTELNRLIDKLPNFKIVSAGIVNGRNIWRTNLRQAYLQLQKAKERLKDRLWVASSCSLMHVPVDLIEETTLDAEIKSWLSFATQKCEEVASLAKALELNENEVDAAFEQSDKIVQSRQSSTRIHVAQVKERIKQVQNPMMHRLSEYSQRAKKQKQTLKLPLFPTTTIGSFPQTEEIRHTRREYKDGKINEENYVKNMQMHIKEVVEIQEQLGLDVLVHGEAERNDMVEYFGELLQGYAFTQNGWVQSYGSRCVKPPIIYGDVVRSAPMTISWTTYAQSLTAKIMKGMLTGPVTMLCWSFVRDDQSRSETAMQIALALRDEIVGLEKNGIKAIQIDEPAFREGLPLRHQDWPTYLEWAVNAFKLAVCGVQDSTQIHTHMCYSEFNDVIESIAAMDADVITIETSRSQMELLEAFKDFRYPNEIGPGVYDIHSPCVPTLDEMVLLLTKASEVIPIERLWVNPDCGLKTRDWPEVKDALSNMVQAAKKMRVKFANKSEALA